VKLYDEPELGSDVGANRQCAQQGRVTRYFEFWTYYRPSRSNPKIGCFTDLHQRSAFD
jgi:hypothetical protein